jgi:hypothetical protein
MSANSILTRQTNKPRPADPRATLMRFAARTATPRVRRWLEALQRGEKANGQASARKR